MKPDAHIEQIKGVGSVVAQKLNILGISTVLDVLEYVPRKFIDYSNIIRVSQIKPGLVTIKVTFTSVKSRYSKRGLHLTEATATDESGSVKVVWFNQPYRAKALKADVEYYVSGEFASNYKYFAITNPSCELVSDFTVNTARLVPVYKLTKGLGVTQLRKIVRSALKNVQIKETLPNWILKQENLVDRKTALQEMHFPSNIETLKQAKKRLAFEEVFTLSLASELNKQEFQAEHAYEIPFHESETKQFVEQLPFELTNDQRRAAWEIFTDMQTGQPMNRLLEGDVGSGKTVVAALSAYGAVLSGFQVVFMAPTELLSSQHFETIQSIFKQSQFSDSISLLTGSLSQKSKQELYDDIASGKSTIIIGTHAVFQEKVKFKKLGLLIIDEQHRFGVEQRKKLQAKAKKMPHVLNMTATPIPRSLALTLYGELDISLLKEKPKNRLPITTELHIQENRQKVYQSIKNRLDSGEQMYVVCPQIEETDNTSLSVLKVYEQLNKDYLKNYKIGLMHGKMSADEKDKVMKKFVSKEIQVLVSTTVIEVGVDVPNASVMIIESADKFGLAQLHQLRGRVGRGYVASICHLILSTNDAPSKRLQIIERENNGFTLAEYDLELRGPGAIYGTMQHGALDLRVAKLTDTELIKSARNNAQQFIEKGENLLEYEELHAKVSRLRAVTNLN